MERICRWIQEKTEGVFRGHPTDRYLMVNGVNTDSRQIAPNQLYIPLTGERFDGHSFLSEAIQRGAAATLWQKDVPLPEELTIPLIVVEDTLVALQKLAKAYRMELGIPVIGITGSNGKTTTKDLVSAVLSTQYRVHKTKGNLNNHIGVPLTLLSMTAETEIAVVEMGMNHAGEIELLTELAQPDIAIITNVGEAHIQFLGSREGIAKAKLEIVSGLKKEGTLVVDGDEALLSSAWPEGRLFTVGWQERNDEFPVCVKMGQASEILFSTQQSTQEYRLPLFGRHNVKNALFAIAVGRLFHLDEEQIAAGLAQVEQPRQRLQVREHPRGMTMIDDTYNSSPTSARASIQILSDWESVEKWILLGDMLELGDKEEQFHRDLGRYLSEQKEIHRIYTIGDRARWIWDELNQYETNQMKQHFTSKEEAVSILNLEAREGVTLLVKASRGMQLDQIVARLLKGG